MKANLILWGIILALIAIPLRSNGTHIIGGNISAEVLSNDPLIIRYKIFLYRNIASVVEIGGGDFSDFNSLFISLNQEADSSFVRLIELGVEEHIFYYSVVYPNKTNDIYVGYLEANRNKDVLNIPNSVERSFYIETHFLSYYNGFNNTPVFLIPPIDKGLIGQEFIHNVGAIDPDGDSLSYELVNPMSDKDRNIQGYDLPISTSIDVFGNLTWNTPNRLGKHAFAIKVYEWRRVGCDWVNIGYVVRDIQITIVDSANESPQITESEKICIQAGDTLKFDLHIMDPDSDSIRLEIFSENINIQAQPVLEGFAEPPINPQFEWSTTCDDIRFGSYPIYFRVFDGECATISAIYIKVIGPSPKGLSGEIQGRTATIKWGPYCPKATQMQIWKRITDYGFEISNCDIGIPEYAGYELIDIVDINDMQYQDHGLARGATYCYRLVAVLPDCSVSAPSDEICVTVPVEAPVITNVSVTETHESEGEIFLRWTSSFDLDENIIQDNYSYGIQVSEQNITSEIVTNLADTIYSVNGQNTNDHQFLFRILLYDKQVLIDSSSWASSVWLEGESDYSMIALAWNAEVPWSNNTQDYPWHYVHRNRVDEDNPDEIILIDSVNVNFEGFNYLDSGQYGAYTYMVTTYGSYGNPSIGSPLRNNSQLLEIYVRDDIPPCTPDLAIINDSEEDCINQTVSQGCLSGTFHNSLEIQYSCEDPDLHHFDIYYSRFGTPDSFTLITQTQDLEFIHQTSTLAGCYYAIAVDHSENKSEPSGVWCRDICYILKLPNIITPNGDGKNDLFAFIGNNGPVNCLAFIEKIHITVTDRSGKVVHSDQISLEYPYSYFWDATDKNEKLVATGVYYYHMKVYFESLDAKVEDYKGWLHVLY